MKNKLFLCLATVSLLFLWGCSSNKLTNTMWYNITMVNNNGTWGQVVTSIGFSADSVFIYNGVVVDTTVVVSPYLHAKGKYSSAKNKEGKNELALDCIAIDGKNLNYNGTYSKKEKVMRLSQNNQNTNETYIWEPEAKLPKSNNKKSK